MQIFVRFIEGSLYLFWQRRTLKSTDSVTLMMVIQVIKNNNFKTKCLFNIIGSMLITYVDYVSHAQLC